MLGINERDDHFDDVTTYNDVYHAQWRYLRERCGADSRPAPAETVGSTFPIPRTTNADARGLVEYWMSVVVAAEAMPTGDWLQTASDVERLTSGATPSAIYSQNNELWRALQLVARARPELVRAS